MKELLPTSLEERKLLFNYGLFILFYNLFTFIIILLIGILLNEIKFTVLLMTLYIPIRIIIGGYHCKTITSCLIIFSLIIMCTIIFHKIHLESNIFHWNIPLYLFTIHNLLKKSRNKITNFVLIFFTIEFLLGFFNNLLGAASFYSVMLISSFYLVDLLMKYNLTKKTFEYPQTTG